MSFLYHRKTKRVIKYVWWVVALLVIIGMVFVFSPGITNMLTQ